MNEKRIAEFRHRLSFPYWNIYEAALLFSGVLESTDVLNENHRDRCLKILRDGVSAIVLQRHLGCISADNEILTFTPWYLISLAVCEGIILPMEMQIAADLFQSPIFFQNIKVPEIKNIKRDAAVQFVLEMHPSLKKEMNISFVCRELQKIQEQFPSDEFCFVYSAGGKRNRDVVKRVLPSSEPSIPWQIAGIVHRENKLVRFDFQRLKFVLQVIAPLLITEGCITTNRKLIDHPLIKIYVDEGGRAIENVVKFCLESIPTRLFCPLPKTV